MEFNSKVIYNAFSIWEDMDSKKDIKILIYPINIEEGNEEKDKMMLQNTLSQDNEKEKLFYCGSDKSFSSIEDSSEQKKEKILGNSSIDFIVLGNISYNSIRDSNGIGRFNSSGNIIDIGQFNSIRDNNCIGQFNLFGDNNGTGQFNSIRDNNGIGQFNLFGDNNCIGQFNSLQDILGIGQFNSFRDILDIGQFNLFGDNKGIGQFNSFRDSLDIGQFNSIRDNNDIGQFNLFGDNNGIGQFNSIQDNNVIGQFNLFGDNNGIGQFNSFPDNNGIGQFNLFGDNNGIGQFNSFPDNNGIGQFNLFGDNNGIGQFNLFEDNNGLLENGDRQKKEKIFLILHKFSPEQIKKYEPIIFDCFLDAVGKNDLESFLEVIDNVISNENKNKLRELFGLTLKDYIISVLKYSNNGNYKHIIENIYRIFKSCQKINKKENTKGNMESIPFNNIKPNISGTSPEENDFNTNSINNISLNNNRQTNSNNFLSIGDLKTEDNTKKENNLNLEVVINNRNDNLFERFKSIIYDSFIDDFNSLVKKENKLSKNNGNFLGKIKGKQDNIDFLLNSFADIFKKYHGVELESICSEENKDAIDLIKKTPSKYIAEKAEKDKDNNKDNNKTFFDNDKNEKEKKTKTDKCKLILYDMFKKKNLINIIILAEFVEKNNKDSYIRIKNLEEFEKKVKSFEGYENINLELTSKEEKKINERIEILKGFLNNPFSHLNKIQKRKPRNENKKRKRPVNKD